MVLAGRRDHQVDLDAETGHLEDGTRHAMFVVRMRHKDDSIFHLFLLS
jgi:hypothetical protein